MTKVLNLDSLVKEERILTFEGISYVMKELAVEDFVELTVRASALDKSEDSSIASRMDFLIDTVALSFPTCPKDVLRRRSVEELNAIVAFARDGSLPEGAQEVEEVHSKKAQKRK